MQTHPPDPNAITSINPPKNLLSLPKELMTDICSRLDQKSAISLLYVHRSFHQPAESRIYRDITLSIPTYWGEPVLIRPPHLVHGTHPYIHWAKKQAKEVEMVGRAEARRRAEEMIKILSRGPERWRYIRKLVIEPRVGANSAIVQILSLAREYIVELEIIKSRDHIYRSQWKPKKGETLWTKLVDFGSFETYTFPNLKVLSVDLEDCDCALLPGHIIQRAAGLRHVTLKGGIALYQGHEADEEGDDCDCRTWYDYWDDYSSPMALGLQTADLSCPAQDDNGSPPSLICRLMHIRSLEKLRISVEDAGEGREWLEDVIDHPNIKHLEYDIPDIPLAEAVELVGGSIESSALRSLIVTVPDISSAHERLQKLDLAPFTGFDNLETLGFRNSITSSGKAAAELQYTPFNDNVHHPHSISSEMTQHLLDMKSLRIIQFMKPDAKSSFIPVEEWEITGTHGIVVRALHHEDDTLLHTRTYSRSIVKKSSKSTDIETTYTTSKQAQWEDATHYMGEVISLRVISSMKRAEGRLDPWVGRGIPVSKEAWQVLLHSMKKNDVSGKSGKGSGGAGEIALVNRQPESDNED